MLHQPPSSASAALPWHCPPCFGTREKVILLNSHGNHLLQIWFTFCKWHKCPSWSPSGVNWCSSIDSRVAAPFPARQGHYSKPAGGKQVGFHVATHKDRIWVTAFDSPSPMHISSNNLIQICFMSAGKPPPRFSFGLDNSHKNPLDFNYGVFHMSSTLRPYVLVSAYSVLSKKHFCTW